jgi:hypothetical protein
MDWGSISEFIGKFLTWIMAIILILWFWDSSFPTQEEINLENAGIIINHTNICEVHPKICDYPDHGDPEEFKKWLVENRSSEFIRPYFEAADEFRRLEQDNARKMEKRYRGRAKR